MRSSPPRLRSWGSCPSGRGCGCAADQHTMNRCGRIAERYWATDLPSQVATLRNPEGFCENLGHRWGRRWSRWWRSSFVRRPAADLPGDPEPEGLALNRAEEMALAELVICLRSRGRRTERCPSTAAESSHRQIAVFDRGTVDSARRQLPPHVGADGPRARPVAGPPR